ncbi:hypothetical protein MJO28_014679 [Puccinia striiformis f. sp. tritici]|uniref:Uncharacterized protein n=1 Tax=Puccinia striiformis f. sp. tritici TaxID=168172 RepID=A0ACC0DUL5_9BASI|nr:hypothetical protein MJO28_014679 [Puccinia striiformis f. sp. tritici]
MTKGTRDHLEQQTFQSLWFDQTVKISFESSTRIRTRSHRTPSQSEENLASPPVSSTLSTSNGLLAVPICWKLSNNRQSKLTSWKLPRANKKKRGGFKQLTFSESLSAALSHQLELRTKK